MNQKTKEKLKMHNPEFYDATENRVAITQEHSLIELFRDARSESGSIATLIGSFSVFLSTMLTLASTETFKEKFGVPASSWQAIFTIVALLSVTITIWESVKLIVRWRRKNFWSEDIVKSKFFCEDKKLRSRTNSAPQSNSKRDAK